MKFESMIEAAYFVFLLYLKFLAIYVAYLFAKFWTAQSRSSTKPPLWEKAFRYAACLGVAAFVGLAASQWDDRHLDESDNEHSAFSPDYNRGERVFLALLMPALFGVASGFTTEDRAYTSRTTGSDNGC